MKKIVKIILISVIVLIIVGLSIVIGIKQKKEQQRIVAEYRNIYTGVWENIGDTGYDKISIDCDNKTVLGFIDKSRTGNKKDYIDKSSIDTEDYNNYQLISHRGLCTDTYTYSAETKILTAVDSVNHFTEQYKKISDTPSDWKANAPSLYELTKKECAVRHCDKDALSNGLCSEHKDGKICPVCGFGYTNSDDTWQISYSNMCVNCYDNYKFTQDVLEELEKYNERN